MREGDPLYEGRYLEVDQLQSSWSALRRSFLLRIQNVRIEFRYLRARCALGAALDAATPPDQRAALRRAARRDIGRLAREDSLWATALADLLGAVTAAADGQRDRRCRRCGQPKMCSRRSTCRFMRLWRDVNAASCAVDMMAAPWCSRPLSGWMRRRCAIRRSSPRCLRQIRSIR